LLSALKLTSYNKKNVPVISGWCVVCANWRGESLGKTRAILQRGIETIRSVGHGSLDVGLSVHLARTFADRVTE